MRNARAGIAPVRRDVRSEMMRQWYKRHGKWIWWIAWAGVAIGYAGLWLDQVAILWVGIVLALPLFLIVLPLCLLGLTAMFTRPLWYPFYWLVLKRNGAPFKPGDVVLVLRGPHKGETATVYEVWHERDQVKLDFGEEAKRKVTDVLCFVSVRKQRRSEQSPPPYGSPAAGSPSGEA